MGQAIGSVLSLALGVAISPLPIVAVVLMLATPRGKVNGPAFVVGWILGLVVVGVIVLLVASGISASSATAKPKTWVSVLKLILGLLLALVAVRQWRHRPAGDADPAMPGWMKTIDSFTPVKSLGLAAVLSGVNPKNLLLNVSAGATIAQAGISAGEQAIVFAIFVAIATLGPGIPLGIYYVMGDHSQKVLAGIRDWMVRNNQAIMAVLCLIIGAKLIGEAIAGFTA
jgi:threonine/homoserine/homoserine lactone efflux protein